MSQLKEQREDLAQHEDARNIAAVYVIESKIKAAERVNAELLESLEQKVRRDIPWRAYACPHCTRLPDGVAMALCSPTRRDAPASLLIPLQIPITSAGVRGYLACRGRAPAGSGKAQTETLRVGSEPSTRVARSNSASPEQARPTCQRAAGRGREEWSQLEDRKKMRMRASAKADGAAARQAWRERVVAALRAGGEGDLWSRSGSFRGGAP